MSVKLTLKDLLYINAKFLYPLNQGCPTWRPWNNSNSEKNVFPYLIAEFLPFNKVKITFRKYWHSTSARLDNLFFNYL